MGRRRLIREIRNTKIDSKLFAHIKEDKSVRFYYFWTISILAYFHKCSYQITTVNKRINTGNFYNYVKPAFLLKKALLGGYIFFTGLYNESCTDSAENVNIK